MPRSSSEFQRYEAEWQEPGGDVGRCFGVGVLVTLAPASRLATADQERFENCVDVGTAEPEARGAAADLPARGGRGARGRLRRQPRGIRLVVFPGAYAIVARRRST
jgi:hypothetical protein